MRRVRRQTWVFFAGWVAATSCGSADTILEVRVQSSGLVPGITQMDVRVTIGSRVRDFLVPEIEQPITLPANFSVQIGPEVNGAVTVHVVARSGRQVLSQGRAELPNLRTGALNVLTINLPPVVSMPGGDGGAGDAGVRNDGGVMDVSGLPDGLATDDGGMTMMMMGDGGMRTDTESPVPDGGSAMDAMSPEMDGGRVLDAPPMAPDVAPDAPASVPDMAPGTPDTNGEADAAFEPDAEEDDANDAM